MKSPFSLPDEIPDFLETCQPDNRVTRCIQVTGSHSDLCPVCWSVSGVPLFAYKKTRGTSPIPLGAMTKINVVRRLRRSWWNGSGGDGCGCCWVGLEKKTFPPFGVPGLVFMISRISIINSHRFQIIQPAWSIPQSHHITATLGIYIYHSSREFMCKSKLSPCLATQFRVLSCPFGFF